MGIEMSIEDLLTFLSMRNNGIFQVKILGEYGIADMVFRNKEIEYLDYAGKNNQEALELLNNEKIIEIISLEELISFDSKSLLEKIIINHLGKIKSCKGIAIIKNKRNFSLINFNKEYINVVKKFAKELIEKEETLDNKIIEINSQIFLIFTFFKKDLHIIVLSEKNEKNKILGFLHNIKAIIYETN